MPGMGPDALGFYRDADGNPTKVNPELLPSERIISKDELDTEPGPIGILPEIPMPEPLTMELTKRAFLQQFVLLRLPAGRDLDRSGDLIRHGLNFWDKIEKECG